MFLLVTLLFILNGSSAEMVQTCHEDFDPNADYLPALETYFCSAVHDLNLTSSDVDKLGPELNWENYTLQTARELVANFDLFNKYGIKETLSISPSVGTRDSFPPAMNAHVSFGYVVNNTEMTFDRSIYIGINEYHICRESVKNYRCEQDPVWADAFTTLFNNTADLLDVKYSDHVQKSPLRQFEMGIQPNQIVCNDGLLLIFKANDGSPACVTPETKQKLIERGWVKLTGYETQNNYDGIRNHPTVKAFYAKYPDTIEEIRSDHISYVTGSDDGFKVRMKLYFDEKYELDHIDFHCYFQREHQNDVPESFILRYLKDFECEKRPALAVVIIPYGSSNPENPPHLIPEEITVVLGKNSTVHWTNNDVVPSTLTSDSQGWSTGVIKPGEGAYVKFNETGVYPYHGEPHPWKVGKVIVLAE